MDPSPNEEYQTIKYQVPEPKAEELHNDKLVVYVLLAVDRISRHAALHLVDKLLIHSIPRYAMLAANRVERCPCLQTRSYTQLVDFHSEQGASLIL